MATDPDDDDDWYSLLDRMKAGLVVPVVGPDLLRNSIRDRLRRAVAADGRTRSPERRNPAGF